MRNHSSFALVSLTMLAACSGSANPSETSSSAGAALSGPIAVRMTSAADADVFLPPVSAVVQIVVTISGVEARVEGPESPGENDDQWVTLTTTPTTLDVMALPGGGYSTLLVARLPAGGLERLRLLVNPAGPNYVVTVGGIRHDLVVPSGAVDIVGDFDVEDCATGSVTLAFSGRKSLAVHPLASASSEWVLRPVVRVSEVLVNGAPCEDEGR